MSERTIEVIRFSEPVPYDSAMEIQKNRREAVEYQNAGNALFLLEHPPVITLGRKANPGNILFAPERLSELGVAVYNTDRGGDVTYHGPGQLIAYPVLNLRQWEPSVNAYLRALEDVLIDTLAMFGIEAGRNPGFTGVWVEDAKVAAIGVGIHDWVTFHGIALNVDPNMEHFRLIIPCGLTGKPVTSMRRLLGEPPAMSTVMDAFEQAFLGRFTPE